MAEISAKLVQELRQKTGAGMLDCKKALKETNGDIEQAIDWLRKKIKVVNGSDRIAAEGLVDTYIQPDGRVGVLIEVNCQTDFVARNEGFKALVKNLAKQAATADSVESLLAQPYIEDDCLTVDEFIKQSIASLGEKRLKELTLLDQPYIRDQSISVEDLVKQVKIKVGEDIQVQRFVRYVLGKGIEKQETNFADEVAAQIGSK